MTLTVVNAQERSAAGTLQAPPGSDECTMGMGQYLWWASCRLVFWPRGYRGKGQVPPLLGSLGDYGLFPGFSGRLNRSSWDWDFRS